MSWVVIALLGAATMGLVGILDKAFLHHFARSYLTLPFLIGVVHGAIGIFLTTVLPWERLTLDAAGWSLLSGVLWATSSLIVFRVLSVREVSRTIPVQQTFPIFVAPMAVVFLSEKLAVHHWLAIFAAVAGAVILSMHQDRRLHRMVLHRAFYLLMGSSLLAATGNITSKMAVETLPVLQTHGIRMVGMAVVLLAFSLRKEVVQEIVGMFRRKSPALVIFGVNELVVANSMMILTLWAISLGPVSLVTALGTASSLFIVLYTTLLGLRFRGLLGEQVSPGVVAVKALSTALIVAGVATISLG